MTLHLHAEFIPGCYLRWAVARRVRSLRTHLKEAR